MGRGGGNGDAQLLLPCRGRVPGRAADLQPRRGEGNKSRGFRQSADPLWMLSQREIQMLALAVFCSTLCVLLRDKNSFSSIFGPSPSAAVRDYASLSPGGSAFGKKSLIQAVTSTG